MGNKIYCVKDIADTQHENYLSVSCPPAGMVIYVTCQIRHNYLAFKYYTKKCWSLCILFNNHDKARWLNALFLNQLILFDINLRMLGYTFCYQPYKELPMVYTQKRNTRKFLTPLQFNQKKNYLHVIKEICRVTNNFQADTSQIVRSNRTNIDYVLLL